MDAGDILGMAIAPLPTLISKIRGKKRAKDQDSQLQGMRKGGKVRATGKRNLHRGESVARKCGRR